MPSMLFILCEVVLLSIAPVLALHVGHLGSSEPAVHTQQPITVLRSLASKVDVEKSEVAIDDLIASYVKKHRAGSTEPRRGWLVAQYGCPRQIGNRMHEFLNGLAVAIVTDRSIASLWTTQGGALSPGTPEECESLLHKHDWIPAYGDQEYGLMEVPVAKIEVDNIAQDLFCSGNKLEVDGGDFVLSFKLEQYYNSQSLSFPGAALSEAAAERAKTLFSMGALYTMGRLLRETFSFDEAEVVAPTMKVFRAAGIVDERDSRTSGKLLVSIHVRTVGGDRPYIIEDASRGLLEAVDSSGGKECFVLLATDDYDKVLDLFQDILQSSGCTLVQSDHGPVDHSFSGEHGDYTGVGALRDIYLLSLGDVFLGSIGSTFSALVAEMFLQRKPAAQTY